MSNGGDFCMGIFGEIDAATNLWGKSKKTFCKKNKLEKKCDDYYFEEFNKKIFVRKNGDGMVISSFILKVIDPSKINSLIRTLDIHDAKESSKFPKFSLMKQCPTSKVFEEFGFWFISDNEIITDIEEFYEDINITKQTDDKFISIKLNVDTSKMSAGKSYKFAYAFSVPGLFPIANGRFDTTSANREQYKDFSSYVSTRDIGHHLRFAAYFEDGMVFKEKPLGYAIRYKDNKKSKKETKCPCNYKDNIFYEKYCFEIDNPQEYEYLCLKWNLKNPAEHIKEENHG